LLYIVHMLVTRRNALKRLVLVSAGAALLPACFRDHSRPPFEAKHFQLDGDQEQQLEELTATLIPGGSTPGAREVSAHLFVLKMLDDCSSKEDQDKFLRGLRQLDNASRQTAGAAFLKADPGQRAVLLTALESQKMSDKDLNFFYTLTKRWTIQAYTTSSYYLTKVQVYELVPGRWHGCVPVKNTTGAAS
jgi:Gluconate 2-dehydrogenase subunit 3